MVTAFIPAMTVVTIDQVSLWAGLGQSSCEPSTLPWADAIDSCKENSALIWDFGSLRPSQDRQDRILGLSSGTPQRSQWVSTHVPGARLCNLSADCEAYSLPHEADRSGHSLSVRLPTVGDAPW